MRAAILVIILLLSGCSSVDSDKVAGTFEPVFESTSPHIVPESVPELLDLRSLQNGSLSGLNGGIEAPNVIGANMTALATVPGNGSLAIHLKAPVGGSGDAAQVLLVAAFVDEQGRIVSSCDCFVAARLSPVIGNAMIDSEYEGLYLGREAFSFNESGFAHIMTAVKGPVGGEHGDAYELRWEQMLIIGHGNTDPKARLALGIQWYDEAWKVISVEEGTSLLDRHAVSLGAMPQGDHASLSYYREVNSTSSGAASRLPPGRYGSMVVHGGQRQQVGPDAAEVDATLTIKQTGDQAGWMEWMWSSRAFLQQGSYSLHWEVGQKNGTVTDQPFEQVLGGSTPLILADADRFPLYLIHGQAESAPQVDLFIDTPIRSVPDHSIWLITTDLDLAAAGYEVPFRAAGS